MEDSATRPSRLKWTTKGVRSTLRTPELGLLISQHKREANQRRGALAAAQVALQEMKQVSIAQFYQSRGKTEVIRGMRQEKELSSLVRRWFSILDKRKGGLLMVDELEAPLTSAGLVFDRKDHERLFADVDKDGSGEIDVNELYEAVKKELQTERSDLKKEKELKRAKAEAGHQSPEREAAAASVAPPSTDGGASTAPPSPEAPDTASIATTALHELATAPSSPVDDVGPEEATSDADKAHGSGKRLAGGVDEDRGDKDRASREGRGDKDRASRGGYRPRARDAPAHGRAGRAPASLPASSQDRRKIGKFLDSIREYWDVAPETELESVLLAIRRKSIIEGIKAVPGVIANPGKDVPPSVRTVRALERLQDVESAQKSVERKRTIGRAVRFNRRIKRGGKGESADLNADSGKRRRRPITWESAEELGVLKQEEVEEDVIGSGLAALKATPDWDDRVVSKRRKEERDARRRSARVAAQQRLVRHDRLSRARRLELSKRAAMLVEKGREEDAAKAHLKSVMERDEERRERTKATLTKGSSRLTDRESQLRRILKGGLGGSIMGSSDTSLLRRRRASFSMAAHDKTSYLTRTLRSRTTLTETASSVFEVLTTPGAAGPLIGYRRPHPRAITGTKLGQILWRVD